MDVVSSTNLGKHGIDFVYKSQTFYITLDIKRPKSDHANKNSAPLSLYFVCSSLGTVCYGAVRFSVFEQQVSKGL